MTRRIVGRLCLAGLGCGVLVSAPVASQGPGSAGTGSIAGRVVVDDTGRPLRGARVSVEGASLRAPRAVITNDEGRFAFTGLPAGEFTVAASKVGYVTWTHGQTKPSRPGTRVRVAEGGRVEGLVLRLPRGAVITGTIRDEAGDPAAATDVRVVRWDRSTGVKRLTQAAADQTDDRGVYRVYGLPAGEYLVGALPRTTVGDPREAAPAVDLSAARIGTPAAQALARFLGAIARDEPAVAYAPVYYPGASISTSARTLTLGPGEEAAGIDFTMSLVPAARIDGTITAPVGARSDARVRLEAQDSNMGSLVRTTTVAPDGSFSFTRLPPGQYTVAAQSGGAPGRGAGSVGERLFGVATVNLEGRSSANVAMTLEPGATLSGRVVMEGAAGGAAPPPDAARMQVELEPAATTASAGGPDPFALTLMAPVDAAGAFTVNGVPPGHYLVRPYGVAGVTAKSALAKGHDALDLPIEIGIGERVTGVIVALVAGVTELAGTLRDARGTPALDCTVVVFSDDRVYWTPQSRRIQATRPNSDGDYAVRDLPAGEYRIATVADLEPGEWLDPAVLDALRATSIRVTLADGEKKRLDLTVGR